MRKRLEPWLPMIGAIVIALLIVAWNWPPP
jgi:hypothetical protein